MENHQVFNLKLLINESSDGQRQSWQPRAVRPLHGRGHKQAMTFESVQTPPSWVLASGQHGVTQSDLSDLRIHPIRPDPNARETRLINQTPAYSTFCEWLSAVKRGSHDIDRSVYCVRHHLSDVQSARTCRPRSIYSSAFPFADKNHLPARRISETIWNVMAQS